MDRKDADGLRIVWSPVNQAWFLMWNESLLRIFNEKAEAQYEMARLRGGGS